MYLASAALAEIATDLRSGKTRLTSYIDSTCDRVDALDSKLRALLPEPHRRARLLGECSAIQALFPDPDQRPALYGLLAGVKDIIHVEGFITRAGSTLPAELFADEEARCVQTLRRAGALILGKTVTTEFAFFEPGPTRNPHNLQHTPGGSSSGSAAAVAAGLCPLGLGTQTIASVIRPAAYCGIVGFKPTYERIPITGVLPFSKSVDTLGLFTQDAAGMASVAPVLCQNWRADATSSQRPVAGIPVGPYLEQASPEGLAGFRAAVARLEGAEYEVRHVPALEDIASIAHRHMQLISAEMATVHAPWFAKYESHYRPRTAALIRDGLKISHQELQMGRASRGILQERLEKLMDGAGIDVWVTPAATGPAPAGLRSTGDPAMSLPWTHAGMPSISLPCGYVENRLPLGLQIVAPFMADERLVAWAEEIASILSLPA